jgi:hypothetical protein
LFRIESLTVSILVPILGCELETIETKGTYLAAALCDLLFWKKRHAWGVKTARGRCGRIRSSWFSLDSGRHCCHLLFIVVSAPLGRSFHGIHIQIGPGRRVLNATVISASLSAYFARHQTCLLYCVTHDRDAQTLPLSDPQLAV